MFVDDLGLTVPPEQRRIAVEPRHVSLKPHTVGQEDRDWNRVLAQVLQNRVLERLRTFWSHHDSLQAVRRSMVISGVSVAQQAEVEGADPGALPSGTQPGMPSFDQVREQNGAAWLGSPLDS